MSLYKRIQNLIGRGENRGESSWGDECIFQRLPAELYAEIFKSLDVRSLRSCKEVCHAWDNFLRHFDLLRKKSITTWNLAKMDYGRKCRLIYKVAVGKIQALNTGLRVNDLMFDGRFYFVMIRYHVFDHVTHLEFANCHIHSYMLNQFGTDFKNVESLILKNVYIEQRIGDEKAYPLNLKTLKISVKDKWETLQRDKSNRTVSIIYPTQCFPSQCLTNQLEEYALEFFDSVLFKTSMDQVDNGRLLGAFYTSAQLASQSLERNAKTLKSFSLKTFDMMDDRVNGLKLNHHEQPTVFHSFGLTNYLGDLENGIFQNLDFSGIQLEKLTLTFRLIQIGLPIAQEVLLPFLRSQTALREFTLSQVLFPGDGAGVMQDLLTNLPTNCHTTLEGLMTLRQCPNNPNHGGILDPPIRGYLDSTVELITQTVNLTLRFVSCQSLGHIDFFTRNLQFLKKIKIQQPGARPANRIVFTDPDVQTIITGAQQLTVLWLEFCNLSAITDFGLSGISQEASARMLLTRDFELQDGDIVGSPISAIKNLRSLNLSDVGNHVTDVTAHHGFKGLGGSLNSFGISSPKMSSDGLELLKRLFQYNQVVKFDARIKFDYSSLGEEIAAPENPLQN